VTTDLANPDAIESYCRRYLAAVNAAVHPSPRHTICAEIPRSVDKELTDRPFYWMWVETMNETPPDTILYLKFRPDAQESDVPERAKPETVTPGCYRFLRIMASAKARGTFAAAYEPAPWLTPYAFFVVKISFLCDSRQDFLESYAIDLRDYSVYPDAMPKIETRGLLDDRPRDARLAPLPADIDQLFRLLFDRVRRDVQAHDQSWAREAQQRLQSELRRLDEYYASLAEPSAPDKPDTGNNGVQWSREAERELRRAEILWRTEPRIEVRPTQFAIVYLSTPPA
jgi:hypothetical protein